MVIAMDIVTGMVILEIKPLKYLIVGIEVVSLFNPFSSIYTHSINKEKYENFSYNSVVQ